MLGNTCDDKIVVKSFATCSENSLNPTSAPTETPTRLSTTKSCHKSARKVRLESTTGQQLQFFELRVFSSAINVALNKYATQSSTLRDNFAASKAVDGESLTFSHTNDINPYFEVDLGNTFEIESVEIVNRWCMDENDPNGCLCRLSSANLKLLDENNSIVASRMLGNTCNDKIVVESFTTCSDPPPVPPAPSCKKSAKKIKLESTTEEPLQIFELEAYSSGINVAIDGSAEQSSTLQDSQKFVASNAIDGNNMSFSHTTPGEILAYLEIDLAGTTKIDSVEIINRWCINPSDEKGCLCRLSNAKLTVYDDNDLVLVTKTFGDTCRSLHLSLELCQ